MNQRLQSFLFAFLFLVCLHNAFGQPQKLAIVPPEIASNQFIVTIDGQQTPVMHAALNLYFLNFTARKHMKITVTAPTDDFWAAGVDVQPWRLGIRPSREGRTISFTLDGPEKITISRPGDYRTFAEMLYLFANPKETNVPTPKQSGIRYIGPGAHTENIDAKSGETIYLAPGAVVFGSLNIWQVDNVKVYGPGVIVYDGPQNPADDDGWMHKPNWHCIVMDHAHNISISDITCVVRSRTWQIQMKDSRQITYDNLKVIGANAGNANADGMDWLGGGDTIVRNSFFRAADDVFAMQSSWEGYGDKAFAVQGSPVTNISVENTEVSTSISNIVRAAWPRKNFEGGNFSMRNSDVLNMGIGGCGVPFALMELWADPAGRGESAGYSFKDIRLDDWYSLVNIRQPTPVRGVHFTDIAGLTQPSLVPSVLQGDVGGVTLDNVVLAGNLVQTAADVPVETLDGATQAQVANTGERAHVLAPEGWIRPGKKVTFEAVPFHSSPDLHFTWIFGDGTKKSGRKVKHRFADQDGTLLDGSGLYRVLLHISNAAGRHTWIQVPIILRGSQTPALPADETLTPGATFSVSSTEGDVKTPLSSGVTSTISPAGVPHPAEHYELHFAADLDVPADGGYVFTVIANDGSAIAIDGKELGKGPAPFAQVCGLTGTAAQDLMAVTELSKGLHHLEITEEHGVGADNFQVLWQSAIMPLQPISPLLLSHR